MTTQEQDATIGRVVREEVANRRGLAILSSQLRQYADELEILAHKLRNAPDSIDAAPFPDLSKLSILAAEYRAAREKQSIFEQELKALGLRSEPVVIPSPD